MNRTGEPDGPAAVEMRRCVEAIRQAHHWSTDEIVEGLAERLVDAGSVRELVAVFEDIDADHYTDMEGLDLISDFAVRAMAEMAGDVVIDVLIEALVSDHPGVIMGAAETLDEIGSRRAAGPLMAAVRHPHRIVRGFAARALGSTGDAAAQDALIPLLADDDWFLRRCAAGALSQLADERALEAVTDAYNRLDPEGDELVPPFLIRALGRMHHPEAEAFLLDLMQPAPDRWTGLRSEAMSALAAQGARAAVGPLIAALGDDDKHIRMSAAQALGIMGDPRAVEPLMALLGDADAGVRSCAAEALGLLGDRRALPPLRNLAETDQEYFATGLKVSDCAREAVEKIEAAAPGPQGVQS